jgi:hypothetical protein
MSRADAIMQSPVSVVVGIDVGTRGTVAAWHRLTEEDRVGATSLADKSQVSIDSPPNADAGGKHRTSVLFRGDEVVSFGKDAEEMYEDAFGDEESTEEGSLFLFKLFKMNLFQGSHDAGKSTSSSEKFNPLCSSVCGNKQMQVSEVMAGLLKLLKRQMLEKLHHGNLSLDESKSDFDFDEIDVQWVITVPAIWTEQGKTMMKKAAKDAGMTRVELALEPEAAALTTVQDLMTQNPCGIPKDQEFLYIVVDGGAGTLDIVVQWLKKSKSGNCAHSIEEIIPATGGYGGSTLVDEAFLEMIEEIFVDFELDEFFKKNPHLKDELRKTFEAAKDGVQDSSSFPYIKLPHEVSEYLKTEVRERTPGIPTLQEAASSWCEDHDLRGVLELKTNRGVAFKLSARLFEYLQCIPVEEVNARLEDVIKHPDIMNHPYRQFLKYLFFVGGFSKSYVMQQALREFCERHRLNLKIPSTIPQDLAIVHGAVLYGLNPKFISARKMRHSYGVITGIPYNPDIHSPDMLKIVAGRRYVFAIEYFVKKDEQMGVDEQVCQSYSPLDTGYKVRFDVVSTFMKGLVYEDDSHLYKTIGSFTVRADGGDVFTRADKFKFTMKFGQSSLKCHVMNDKHHIDRELVLELNE